MFRFLGIAVISFALSGLAQAQDPQDHGQSQQPQQERPDGGQGRQPGARGQGGGRGGMGFMGGGRMMDRFIEDLNLDEQQKQVFDELMAPQRERMRQVGEKFREMREAQDSGDNERVEQIRTELRDMGMGPGGPGGRGRGMQQMQEQMNQVWDQLEPSLRDDQIEKLDEMRDRMERGQQTMDAARRIREELPDTLNLDESQRQQFQEMLDQERDAMRQQFQSMQPLFEQMREARENGDDAKVAELRKQMEAGQPDFEARTADFLTRIEGMLTPEQKTALGQFRDDVGIGGTDGQAGDYVDVKDLIRMAKRVRLNDEQKDEFKDIERDAMRDYRKAGRDKDARAALSGQVQQDIEKILDDRQIERFHQQIERAQRRHTKK